MGRYNCSSCCSILSWSILKDLLVNNREQKNLLQQAVKATRENALSCISVADESEDSDIKDIGDSSDNDVASKKTKYDPFAEFRNAALDTSKGTCHESKDFEADVEEELRHYNSIAGISLQQPDAVRSVFDPLLWWGQQRHSFPILSYLVGQLLVIPASSAESEWHFSGAGHIACKDRNQLKDDAVECTVVYYEAVRKGII